MYSFNGLLHLQRLLIAMVLLVEAILSYCKRDPQNNNFKKEIK